jgi:hypothetical protein
MRRAWAGASNVCRPSAPISISTYQASFTPEEIDRKEALYNFTQSDPGSQGREGLIVFYSDPTGRLLHTYSIYARGIDAFNTAYNLLDVVPKSRGKNGRGPFWVRRRDEYGKVIDSILRRHRRSIAPTQLGRSPTPKLRELGHALGGGPVPSRAQSR